MFISETEKANFFIVVIQRGAVLQTFTVFEIQLQSS